MTREPLSWIGPRTPVFDRTLRVWTLRLSEISASRFFETRELADDYMRRRYSELSSTNPLES